jgi:hypothetical protein
LSGLSAIDELRAPRLGTPSSPRFGSLGGLRSSRCRFRLQGLEQGVPAPASVTASGAARRAHCANRWLHYPPRPSAERAPPNTLASDALCRRQYRLRVLRIPYPVEHARRLSGCAHSALARAATPRRRLGQQSSFDPERLPSARQPDIAAGSSSRALAVRACAVAPHLFRPKRASSTSCGVDRFALSTHPPLPFRTTAEREK